MSIFLKLSEEEKDLFPKSSSKILSENAVCFGELPNYWPQSGKTGRLIFGFSYKTFVNVEKMVEDFNKFFTNAQVEILIKQKICLYSYGTYTPYSGYMREYSRKLKEEKVPDSWELVDEQTFVVYHLNFNEEYSNFAQFCLTVLLGEILRLPGEAYFGELFEDYFNYEHETVDYIEKAINVSNTLGVKSGNIFFVNTKLEELQIINDPILFSRLVLENISTYGFTRYVKPTSVINLIKRYLEDK